MAVTKKEENRVSARVFSCLSLIAAAVLLVVGIACYKTGSNMVSMINKALVEQKVTFPPANPAVFPAIAKYAGKPVNDGPSAKAYSDGFLNVQLKLMGNGKTVSEVAAAAAADPKNVMLQQLQGAMFQLSTINFMVGSSYGTWAQGNMIKNLGVMTLVASAGLLLVSGVQYMRYKKLS